jgi:hypothetical protein
MRSYLLLFCASVGVTVSGESEPLDSRPIWTRTHQVEPRGDGFVTTGVDPILAVDRVSAAVEPERCYLELTVRVSAPVRAEFRWWRGVEFQVLGLRFLRLAEVPETALPVLVDFRCVSSRLHFLPQDPIPFRASFEARNLPARDAARFLDVALVNSAGTRVAGHAQYVGVHRGDGRREVFGVLAPPPDRGWASGRHRLQAALVDLAGGKRYESEHDFGVLGPDDAFVYETPFAFVKDFSLIRAPDGLWHVFSITGESTAGHDWQPPGQERTFSHGTSRDLRHWTYHHPVLSIHERTFPDGNGRYQDRNVWAPHVIRHGERYHMFYTSVNRAVCQSVSLAVSEDLYNWTEIEHNPVFTLEGVDWALWQRDAWSDCRDPMVLADDDGRFYLYVTATAREAQPEQGGGRRGLVRGPAALARAAHGGPDTARLRVATGLEAERALLDDDVRGRRRDLVQ